MLCFNFCSKGKNKGKDKHSSTIQKQQNALENSSRDPVIESFGHFIDINLKTPNDPLSLENCIGKNLMDVENKSLNYLEHNMKNKSNEEPSIQ